MSEKGDWAGLESQFRENKTKLPKLSRLALERYLVWRVLLPQKLEVKMQ
jgi:hypothetical protein